MWSQLTVDFDASEWFIPRAGFSPANELEALSTSDSLVSFFLLASRDLNISIKESDVTSYPDTGNEFSLKASVKHSLATSIPSASTPQAGSTIPHEPN